MITEEALEQIKQELFFNLKDMRNQIDRFDYKITSISNEMQKDQKNQEKDFEHLKESVKSKIENMQNNIDWVIKYADNNRSDNKDHKQNTLTIIGLVIAGAAAIIGALSFFGITLQNIKNIF